MENLISFFEVVGFFFVAICFVLGFKIIATLAYLGYQTMDLRMQTMAKRVSELREEHFHPIEINQRKKLG